ncbi:MAG: glycosyltransferase [candidate division KSB1 bacterium]|nr:glycosyltransferase [candidate division KSB1 bacterium]
MRALRQYCDLRTFGLRQADVRFDPVADSFQDILERLAPWRPDVVIVRDAEYYPLPFGIDQAPVPVVALVGDWNVCYTTYAGLLRRFDLLLTDRAGEDVLRRDGVERVQFFPLYGFDPELHRPAGGGPKKYDVAVVANLNQAIHGRRARLLYRLASLPPKYRIRIDTELYGEAYVRLLQSAELVFNCSVRGELNMRSFEAPACGAVLLLESDNLECGSLFVDGEHLFLYDEETLDKVVATALADRRRLRQVRERMNWALQRHSYAERAKALVQLLREFVAGKRRDPGEESPGGAWRDWARYYLGIPHPSCLLKARQILEQHVREEPVHLWTIAGIVAHLAAKTGGYEQEQLLSEAQSTAGQARHEFGVSMAGAYNVATGFWACRRATEAHRFLEMCRNEGSPRDPLLQNGFVIPGTYGDFRMLWQRAWTQNAGREADRARDAERVIHGHVNHLLGEIAFQEGRFEEAARFWLEAVRRVPEVAETRHHLACAQWKLGERWAAYENLRQCLQINPFHFPAWFDSVRMLAALGRWQELDDFVRQRLSVVRRIPPYAEAGLQLSALWRSLRPQNRGKVSAYSAA